ncbi:DUF4302 domain-containing protein [Myroides pelagicus]|uniref:DUF4302 domain-containing protein n=1 Tax=Myroides pelagicus TaxID=270914 RepID=A0A7K1GLZ8_9FLAO|nr:DUF4302 domain-containing protein [Myroides pelagicus]MEC4114202.1 DUF4302 domain-containing protein [Myroides pelagicus]MTH29760.1 DUF4302 domain-containing protein [Myroides pelagicus]
MKRILMHIGVLATVIVSAVSCQSDNFDSKFDENPTERLENRRTELRNELVYSTYGWKMTYFTDDTQLGGFTHLFKFIDDRRVVMASDFFAVGDYNPLQPKESEYKLQLSNTIGLLFTTDNYIHLLGNNSIVPPSREDLYGVGYKGDFEYSYYSSEGHSIYFKTVRDHIGIKFERATQQDWNDLQFNQITSDVLKGKKKLIISNASGETQEYNFSFKWDTRFARIVTPDGQYSVNRNAGVGVGLRKDGIIISPAIDLADGTAVTEFRLEGGSFKAEINGNTVTIL